MKRALTWVGLVALLLVIAVFSIWYSAFGSNRHCEVTAYRGASSLAQFSRKRAPPDFFVL